ncbi:hypothetical protein AXK11_03480 [Cephaloticoccus primus]|uniref:Membrane transport protein MMPL domain-containing protein n=1 Tax=Cephaloticoccus primus TaxID=1548207 RepID=A0A139SQW0_9BACT|nr:hypothetical protein AXK11_03480 [Cephaloticoccus primus]
MLSSIKKSCRTAECLSQLALILLLSLAAWQCRHGWPISFDVLALVPQTSSTQSNDKLPRELRQFAQDRIQAPLSHQVLALVAHQEAEQALEAAQLLATSWRKSNLFSFVELEPSIDLATLRAQLLKHRLALLPVAQRRQLVRQPETYIAQRAAQLSDPFSSVGAVPLGQDLLGLASYAQNNLLGASHSNLVYDLSSGTLQAEAGNKTWILLRAYTHTDAFNSPSSGTGQQKTLSAQIIQDRNAMEAIDAELLVAGGPLYADQGRTQATREVTLIGSAATVGITLLLLLALRHPRALLAFLPVLTGLAVGIATCILVFGSIHILTLVIGTSLIGVAVDFPLHWLGKSYGMQPWHANTALRRVLPGVTISLAASLIGYLALLFTPFMALTQTAIFSAAGLLGAYACTVYQLPTLIHRWQPRPWPPLLRLAQTLLRLSTILARYPKSLYLSLSLITLGAFGGIHRLALYDDLRQWLSLEPEILHQAQRIGELTGIMPSSQFLLVQAASETELLQRQKTLTLALDQLKQDGMIGSYQALSQLVTSQDEQLELKNQLTSLAQRQAIWQPIIDLGVPLEALQAELHTVAQLPLTDINTALTGHHAEAWQNLWLGQHEGSMVGLVTLFDLKNSEALRLAVQGITGVTFIDRSGDLNQLFTATRAKAAELKLLSYIAAALLLGLTLGRASIIRILAVPLCAVVLSLAVLGWTGQPLTLFSLFGLLLVSALGVDYAIFMYEGVFGAAASLVGILLSATTTLLSFGLLAFSQTPVIANFGLSVALGVAFSLLLALWIKSPQRNAQRKP